MAISPRVEPAASRYGSTPSSRESVSSDSPRRSRSATSRFRAAVHRCPEARGPFGVPGAAGSTPGGLALACAARSGVCCCLLFPLVAHDDPVLLGLQMYRKSVSKETGTAIVGSGMVLGFASLRRETRTAPEAAVAENGGGRAAASWDPGAWRADR